MAGDFDFQIGSWLVKHRRLKARLANCDDWEEFDGTCDMRPILGGNGNVEDNVLYIPSGTYRAIALRSFDPAQKSWIQQRVEGAPWVNGYTPAQKRQILLQLTEAGKRHAEPAWPSSDLVGVTGVSP